MTSRPVASIRPHSATTTCAKPAFHVAFARLVRVFPLVALFLFTSRAVQAQSTTGRIIDALTSVVGTIGDGAHNAAVAFRGETLSVIQSQGDPKALSSMQRTRRALTAVFGVSCIGVFLAIVVMITAEAPLDAVARAAERDVSKSFWIGVLWQVLAAPLLLVLALALALTILLLPAIPIAMMAWALAYAGATTLGLFAVALVLGRALLGRSTSHNRGALLSSLLAGMTSLTLLWVAAALFVSVPTFGIVLRIIALAISWVAATVGLGAVVRSRAGTLREHMETTTIEAAVPSWQTPTPVFGVVAARRPTPVNTTTLE